MPANAVTASGTADWGRSSAPPATPDRRQHRTAGNTGSPSVWLPGSRAAEIANCSPIDVGEESGAAPVVRATAVVMSPSFMDYVVIEPPSAGSSERRQRMKWLSWGLMLMALIIGCGPGLLLVNSPEPFLGWPRLFVWGAVWYFVQVAGVLVAYRFVWTDTDSDLKQ